MPAMNGARRASKRRLCRLLGCVVALVALSAMAVPSVAAAMKPKPPKLRYTYVALGDSLAFGFSEHGFNENFPAENPAAFEHGYANDYLNLVNAQNKDSVQLVNDGCPGETTESLIGDNPALLAEINHEVRRVVHEPVTGEAPCEYHYKDTFALHHEYGGTKSQLESVIETIKVERAAHTPVKMISLDIGANDELHTVAKAEKQAEKEIVEKVTAIVEAYAKKKVEEKVKQIAKEEVEAYVIEQVVPQAYEETGGVEPEFAERVEQLAYEYSEAHAKKLEDRGISDAIAYELAHGAELYAEGKKIGEEFAATYEAEHGLELLEEGESITLAIVKADTPALFEQIDTNVIGILAAIHHAGYHGRVIFEGTYDAYGRVKGVTKFAAKLIPGENHQTELYSGFNKGVAELAALEQATLKPPAVQQEKVCYSDAETLFNPASVNETLAEEELEEERMATWTNMANFTEFEYAPGKKLKFDEKVEVAPGIVLHADGPDIHATSLGYEKMAEQMNSTCAF